MLRLSAVPNPSAEGHQVCALGALVLFRDRRLTTDRGTGEKASAERLIEAAGGGRKAEARSTLQERRWPSAD